MKNSPLQLALREWRQHISAPPRAAALIGSVLILTIVAPFDTAEHMRALPRLAYWAALVGLSYSAGYAADRIAAHVTADKGTVLQRSLIAAPVTAVLVFLIVWLLNGFSLGHWPKGLALAAMAGTVMLIAGIIAVLFQFAHANAAEDSAPPPLLARLPFDKRGPLVSLSVEDHYVHVRTTKGAEMLLMRLADAIGETAPTQGLHVHRSHWVALGQVTAVARKGDGALLTLSSGPDIPVSRSNMSKLKEAGLTP